MNIGEQTAERLRSYYPFSPDVIDTVAVEAERQSSFLTYQDYLGSFGINADSWPKNSERLDIRPREHDSAEGLIVHLPMGNPLDMNQLFQIATIIGTNPSKRVIAEANPGGPGYNAGTMNADERDKMRAAGSFRPAVQSLCDFLNREGIGLQHHYGASYGADKLSGAIADRTAAVFSATVVEPVSVKTRTTTRLAKDFVSSNSRLNEYVEASDMATFVDARKDSVGLTSYGLGLLRPTNLAIVRALGYGQFEQRMDRGIDIHPEMVATIVWGSESELAIDGLVGDIVTRLNSRRGKVRGMRLEGQGHALVNDIHLQAALVLEGQRPQTAV